MSGQGGSALLSDDSLTHVSDELQVLARLHRHEADDELIRYLQDIDFCNSLVLGLEAPGAPSSVELMARALQQLQTPLSQSQLDELHADFSAIYLTNGYRASPYESVWLSEEQLTQQESMFQVRACYGDYGLENPDWRSMPDDHVCLQLQFLSTLLSSGKSESLRDAADFMDKHLLLWISGFCTRVSDRCGTAFYAGICLLTDRYCNVLRDLLGAVLDEPRPAPEELAQRATLHRAKHPDEIPLVFVPGQKPSW